VWQEYFSKDFKRLGTIIRQNQCRVSMHPNQFVLLNAPREDIVGRSIAELEYHASVLDLMGLDTMAKIQIHVGGVYGDKDAAIGRFVEIYQVLDPAIRRRLVIENDERLYTVSDCLQISRETGVPVLFDVFHHALNNHGECIDELIDRISETWKPADGLMMVDYSSQQPGKRVGAHAETIDPGDFSRFLYVTRSHDMDIMLEIKDKEKSARTALQSAAGDPRLVIPIS
jgi:UV DNA damage endonuclease